jgi:hypothetical protein
LNTPKNAQKLSQPLRRKAASASNSDNITKAYLRNFGNGKLQFTEQGLKFYVEKGRLKKQKEIAKEILLTGLERVTLEANELAVSWNGTTDRFVIDDKKLAAEIFEKMNAFLNKQVHTSTEVEASVPLEPTVNEPNSDFNKEPEQVKKSAELIPAELTRDYSKGLIPEYMPNALVESLKDVLQTVDLLFDILGSFHGVINWNRVKISAEQAQEKIENSESLKSATANFYFPKLLSDIQEHDVDIIPKEAYSLLESIYMHFQELTSREEVTVQIDPSPKEIMTLLDAYYLLNDVSLAMIVGDENVQDEINQLAAVLENLKAKPSFAVDPQGVIKNLGKFGDEKMTKEVIDASRAIFKQQLKFLKKRNSQKASAENL